MNTRHKEASIRTRGDKGSAQTEKYRATQMNCIDQLKQVYQRFVEMDEKKEASKI